MDRRLTPSNGRVAAAYLRGQVEAERFVEGQLRQINAGVADLWRHADGTGRERQQLYGEHFRVLEDRGGFAFGQSERDGYVGYIQSSDLVGKATATHIVATRGTHLYPVPDLKGPEVMALSFGARLRIVSAEGAFFETHAGLFVPKSHLRPANAPFTDPASIAQLFFGAPYLWGGNSAAGIDCSGLIQVALLACGIPCPGDSDLQEISVGKPLSTDSKTLRGDLFFWQGHVAIAVDEQTLIHANAHSMSVAYEPIDTAIVRIAEQGGGPVTARKRP